MINIRIERNSDHDIQAYSVTGHAQTAAYGEDIVCAAISALAQTTLLGIHHILGQHPTYRIEEGNLVYRMMDQTTPEQRKEANILLETMLLGFENIRQQYPEVITIENEEV